MIVTGTGGIYNLQSITPYAGEVYAKNGDFISSRNTARLYSSTHYVEFTGCIDPHGIYIANNKVNLVSSSEDIVYTFDYGLNLLSKYKFGVNGFRHHVNDVTNDLVYTLFSISGLEKFDESTWPNQGGVLKNHDGVINPATAEVLVSGLSAPHSPTYWNGRLYYCNSMMGELCCDGVVIHRWPDTWTRGLYIDNNHIYVGIGHTLAGDTRPCWLCVLDHSGEVLDRIQVPLSRINTIV